MLLPNIETELAGIDFGDARLTKRLESIAEVLQRHPEETYPDAFMDSSDTDTFYKFLKNKKTDYIKIIDTHIKKTNQRALGSETVLILHDSTYIVHASGGKGKDFYELLGKSFGYMAHVGLCIDCDTRIPFGVSNLECIQRDDTLQEARQAQSDVERWMNENKESLRWIRGVMNAKQQIQTNRIHVMDREGDNYQLLEKMTEENERFVIRGCYDRNILIDNKKSKISTIAAKTPVIATRKVHLSKRVAKNKKQKSNKSRQARDAFLTIHAFQAEIMKSTMIPDSIKIMKSIRVNVVLVQEDEPPPEQEAVCWTILTTESIDSTENVLKIVDIYRNRWIIEDLFKSLKTGCSFSERQLESQKTSQVALAITLPIAWRLLLIRQLARDAPELPALTLVSEEEIFTLSTILKKPPSNYKTVRDVWRGIAQLGGYLPHNRPPGWLVLGRGFAKLMQACSFAQAMRQKIAEEGSA